MAKDFPCKGCKNREVGCHAYCEEYNEAKVWHEKVKQTKRSAQDVSDYMIETSRKRAERNKRKYGGTF